MKKFSVEIEFENEITGGYHLFAENLKIEEVRQAISILQEVTFALIQDIKKQVYEINREDFKKLDGKN